MIKCSEAQFQYPLILLKDLSSALNKAFIRHLYIAKGSSGELRTQIHIAIKQGYIIDEKGIELIAMCKKLSSMIYKFILARKIKTRRT